MMRALSWSLFALVVVPVAACRSEPAGPPAHPDLNVGSAGGEIELRLGQAARVGEERLVIRFAEVPEDSRCPTGVACVWAGNARVVLATRTAHAPETTVELNTTLAPSSARLSGWSIELIELEPWPVDGAPIPEGGYVARLTISRP